MLGTPEARLGDAEFREIGGIVRDVAGIRLPPGKESLVRSRLAKRLRARGVSTYAAYLDLVRDPRGDEAAEMVDALTTNKTDFFREPAHFEFLRERVLPSSGAGPLRVWSAGCSTGEEPLTIAMVLREAMPDAARRDVRVLATDLSRRALARATAGAYADAAMEPVPNALRQKYFARAGAGWTAGPALRALVTYAPLNLMREWPMRGPFQVIFCRNVMIYFDRATQQRLVRRFHDLLAPGGHLFVGHAESLSGVQHGFRYVQPAVYAK